MTQLLVRQRLAQVDAVDLGSDGRGIVTRGDTIWRFHGGRNRADCLPRISLRNSSPALVCHL